MRRLLNRLVLFGLMGGVILFSASANAESKMKKKPAPSSKVKPNTATRPSETVTDSADLVTEKRSDGTIVKYKKKTSYDFEGASIEGLYNKPSGSYISNIKDVKGKSIIRIRENFDSEVLESPRQMK